MGNKEAMSRTWLGYSLILLLLIVGYILRLEHLLARVFHVDEYISMLAVTMTAQNGVPVFPSGLFYHQGFLASYLTVPLVRLVGFGEEIMRWPSLLVGMVTTASFYLVGRRLFSSRAAGLFSLAFATLDVTMIVWSARVRMYALAGLFMVLALYFLAEGTFLNPRRSYRLVAAVFYLGAMLSHSVAVVILPVWVLATVIAMALGHKKFKLLWYRQKSLYVEIVIALVLLMIGVGFGVLGQIPFLSPESTTSVGAGSGILGVLNKFLDPGLSWERVNDFIYYFTTSAYWPLAILAGFAFVGSLVSVARGQFTRRDLATLFLATVLLLTIAELGLALVSTWRKTRYLFILCQAPFLLLAADGLARLGRLLSGLKEKWPKALEPAGLLLGSAAILGFWAGPAIEVANAHDVGGYDTAFEWVKEHWQEGDRVMTVHPSASYLYLGRSDYYATQLVVRTLVDDETNQPVDRYVGSELVDSVDTFNKILSEKGRVWFVVDKDRLFSRYEPFFVQQVFAQMDYVYQGGITYAFISRPYPVPLPAEPMKPLDGNFGNLVRLEGYSLDTQAIAPDGTISLGLYWRPVGSPTRPMKVFVHVRNAQDETITQADHLIYEGLLVSAEWDAFKAQGDWLRDTADLRLPVPMPADGGPYRIYVGIYDPDTLERVPVINDSSGENAVVIDLF